VLPGALLFLLIIVIPTIATFALSLFRWDSIGPLHFIGTLNYLDLVAGKLFWTSFANNFIVLIFFCTFPIVLGMFLAVFLANVVTKRLGPATANVFRATYYLPQVIPGTAFLLAWRWILGPDTGALNSVLRAIGLGQLARPWLGDGLTAMLSICVILVWVHTGLCMILFIAGLSRIDQELYDSLSIDGSSHRSTFFGVILPELSYEIKVLVIFGILEAFKLFDFAYILTKGGPGFSTYFAAYYLYQAYFYSADIGLGATISTILTLGVLLISILSVRVRVGYER
jgi:raffinose/stachyose/melibiose transport system permease protein